MENTQGEVKEDIQTQEPEGLDVLGNILNESGQFKEEEVTQEVAGENVTEPEQQEIQESEEEIEDRIGVVETQETKHEPEKTPEPEQKIEKVVEKKKTSVPFKSDIQKVIYNYLSENDGDILEVASLLKEGYKTLSPESLIEYEIKNNPLYANASQKYISTMVQKKINGLKSDFDLDDPEDAGLYQESLKLEAARITQALDQKRVDILSKYSGDVEIEYEQESEVPVESEEELKSKRDGLIESALSEFQKVITEPFVKIQDKDGPISIPVQDMRVIAESIVDPISFIRGNFTKADGSLDFERYTRWVNYAANMDIHDNVVIKKGIAIGKQAVVKGIKNTSQPQSRTLVTETQSGDPFQNMDGFLDAFRNNARVV